MTAEQGTLNGGNVVPFSPWQAFSVFSVYARRLHGTMTHPAHKIKFYCG